LIQDGAHYALHQHCTEEPNAMPILRIAAATVATLCLAAAAASQTYPTKPVRIVTGGAGTFHDIVTRQLAQRLAERWGQPVVVENQPAAALTVGTGMVARAAPDGYTLVMTDRSAVAVAPHLFKSVPYDPAKDFAPVTLAALSPSLLVANPSVPAASFAEFLAYAKAQPGGVHFASAGPGTNPHVAMELFRLATGVNVVPVHYKGGGASSAAILGGEVKAGFGTVPVLLPHVKSGKLKAYIVTGTQRFPGAPDVPTAAETGVPGFELEFWIGLLAPAGTPPPVIARLNRDVGEILRSPELQATLLAQGARAAPGTPEEFAAFIGAESAKMRKLVDATGMRAE
jgi:tripartite-type tricarboxylate transporter receptor subunit TctC